MMAFIIAPLTVDARLPTIPATLVMAVSDCQLLRRQTTRATRQPTRQPTRQSARQPGTRPTMQPTRQAANRAAEPGTQQGGNQGRQRGSQQGSQRGQQQGRKQYSRRASQAAARSQAASEAANLAANEAARQPQGGDPKSRSPLAYLCACISYGHKHGIAHKSDDSRRVLEEKGIEKVGCPQNQWNCRCRRIPLLSMH